jgi:ribosome-associated protein
MTRAGSRLTRDGVLILTARRFRTQERNRSDAIARLVEMIRAAATPPRPRHKTRVPGSAKKRRTDAKKRRSATKRLRGPVRGEE